MCTSLYEVIYEANKKLICLASASEQECLWPCRVTRDTRPCWRQAKQPNKLKTEITHMGPYLTVLVCIFQINGDLVSLLFEFFLFFSVTKEQKPNVRWAGQEAKAAGPRAASGKVPDPGPHTLGKSTYTWKSILARDLNCQCHVGDYTYTPTWPTSPSPNSDTSESERIPLGSNTVWQKFKVHTSISSRYLTSNAYTPLFMVGLEILFIDYILFKPEGHRWVPKGLHGQLHKFQ